MTEEASPEYSSVDAGKTVDSFTSVEGDVSREGSNATRQGRNGTPSVVRRRGRKRGARSMGRNPLKTRVTKYLEANIGILAEETLKERARKLRAFERRYAMLCETNSGMKRDPAIWGEKEMVAILLEIRGHGWSTTTQARELENIQGVLSSVDNGILEGLKVRYPHMFPKRLIHRGSSLNEKERNKMLEATKNIGGWNGEVARFLIHTHLLTGLRPKELRTAHVEDLDTRTWILRVRHPKGEGSYGSNREIPLPAPLRPVAIAYLRAREQMLAKHGLLYAEPLLCRKDKPHSFYSANRLRSIKARVEELSGVKFELRTLRRTYGQMLVDGSDLETASIALGHNSVKTTQAYYCQKNIDTVKSNVLRVLENAVPTIPSAKSSLISQKDYLTGYG